MYEEALKDGKTQIPHIKFVLLGEAGHGKTSLLRLLEGEEFKPDWTSTEGIDCDLISSKTFTGTDEACWKKHDRLTYPEALANIVVKNLSEPDTPAMRQRSHQDDLTEEVIKQQIARLFHPPPPQGPMCHTGHPRHRLSLHASPRGVPAFESPSTWEANELHPPSPHPRIRFAHDPNSIAEQPEAAPDPPRLARMVSHPGIGRALDRALSKLKEGGNGAENPKLTFTTYDFAGQDLYRPMHHCFITQRSVFVIVFNSQVYNKLRRENDESRYKYISYWFNTVSAYTEVMDPKLGRKPPVFLVGTHRGPYDDGKGKRFLKLAPDDEKEIREDLEKCYKKDDDYDRYIRHLKGSAHDHFYFVESSQENKESGAPGLRCCLRKKADSLPYMKQEYPVRWLQLEEMLKDQGLVLLADVKEKAKAVGFPFPPSGGECKEFELAMKFLHDIGVITYPCKCLHQLSCSA